MSTRCLPAGYLVVLLQAFLVSCLPQIDIAVTVIEEVLVPDSVIRNLTEDPRIKSRFSRDDLATIRYQYLSSKPVAFAVDESGALRTTGWVDRENICPNTDICKVEFDLAIQPIKYFALIKVTIIVQDINDHSPLFVRSEVTHIISESTRTGMTFVLPKVTDPDSPQFSVKRVFLRPPTDQFGLRTNDELHGMHAVRLVLRSPLDRESVPEYHLQVVAVDGGSPAKSGTLDVTILVADANDNHPTFDQDAYEVTVPENVPPGYIMLSVHATDLDIGLNSRIVYAWSPDTAASLGHIFHINNDTGEITVRGQVDYEEASVLYLTVEAQDCGADPIPAEAIITVHVEDVNDHAPEILIHTLGGPGNDQVTVMEGTAEGTFVARIVVSDRDSGQNSRYNCSLDSERFVLDPLDADFLITTRGELDREKQDRYSLAVSCRDHGRKPLTSITYIRVQIADLNDNSPRFSKDAFYTRINENNYPRTVLLQINATDADSGRNGQIQYAIDGPESRWFSIDRASGVVRTRVSLDRELKASHKLSIIATDRGDPPKSSKTTLTVDVLDTNDEAPIFSQETYVFRVYENEDPETAVGFVQADDADSSLFNHHTYSLQADSQSPFRIGMKNGRIRTKRRLDREQKRLYVLSVVAMDTSEPYYSSTATVSIHVLDRNDNPPRFTFPTPRNNTALIGNNLPVGYVVTKVHAEDIDWDSNGQVRYELVQPTDGDVHAYFDVEPYTGMVTLASSLTHVDNDTFALTVIASDGGDVTMSTSAILYVIVDERYAVPLSDVDVTKLSNFITIIIVACISGILVVLLVGGILVICHRRRHLDDGERRHKGQMEPLKEFPGKEASALGQGFPKNDHCPAIGDCYMSDNDQTMSFKYTQKYGCHENHFIPNQTDLTLGKPKSWVDTDIPKDCRMDVSRKDSATDSLDLVLTAVGENDQDQTGSDDSGLHTTLEYGVLRGFYKNPVGGPPTPTPDPARDGYGGNFRTFTGKTTTITNASPHSVRVMSPSYPSQGVRSNSGQLNRIDCDSSTDSCHACTSDPDLVSRHSPVSDPSVERRTSAKPYLESLRVRCHDSLTRSPQYQATSSTLPYISAHGYRDDVIQSGNGRHLNQPTPSSAKRLRFNLENVSDYCRAKPVDNSYTMDDTTTTHTENGVKVTDIVT